MLDYFQMNSFILRGAWVSRLRGHCLYVDPLTPDLGNASGGNRLLVDNTFLI